MMLTKESFTIMLSNTLLQKISLEKPIGVQFLEKLRTMKSEIMNLSIKVLLMKKDYLAGKGDMQFIINMVPFSPVYEEDRFQEVLGKIIEKEDLQRFKAFSNEPPSKEKKY